MNFVAIRCIDAQKIFVLVGQSIDKDIVFDASLPVTDHRILRVQRLKRRDIIGGDRLQESQGAWPIDHDTAHMTHVEQPGLGPDRLVLIHHPTILDRHFPAGEINELGTGGAMLGDKRGLFHGKQSIVKKSVKS